MSKTDCDTAEDGGAVWGQDDDRSWVIEQREAVEAALGARAWEDLCIQRSDPSEPAFWGEDDPLDFDD